MEPAIVRTAKIAPIVRFWPSDSGQAPMGVGYWKVMSMPISAAAAVEPAVAAAVVVAPTVLEVSSVNAAAEEAWVDNWDVVGDAVVLLVEGDKDDKKVLGPPYRVLRARKDEMLWEPVRHDKAWDSVASDGDMEYQLDLALVAR